MRLILRQTLAAQIAEEIEAAMADGCTVERVECSRAEMAELAANASGKDDPRGCLVRDGEFFVLGVAVVLEGSMKRVPRVLLKASP